MMNLQGNTLVLVTDRPEIHKDADSSCRLRRSDAMDQWRRQDFFFLGGGA